MFPVTEDHELRQRVAADMESDSRRRPGEHARWTSRSAKSRDKHIRRLVRGERFRAEFESVLRDDREAEALWAQLLPSHQREFLWFVGDAPTTWHRRRRFRAVRRMLRVDATST